MKVVLLDYVKNLGYRHDVVEVKPGYANNFLIPNKLAIHATPSNLKVIEENKRQAAHRLAQRIAEAQRVKEAIESTTLIIETLVGQDDRIYGSVTTLQLANHLKDSGYEVDRRKITILSEEVNTIGTYQAEVVLEKDVKAVFNFEVKAKNV